MRNIMLHNVLAHHQSNSTVMTSPKELQERYARDMAVAMADDSTENVFKNMLLIADQESDYPPLTKE